MRGMFAVVLITATGLTNFSSAAAEPAYKLDIEFYRIVGTPVIYTEEWPLALLRPISIEFKDAQLSEILEALAKESGIPIVIDDGLIAPQEPQKATQAHGESPTLKRIIRYVTFGQVEQAQFVDVPINQILEQILKSMRLAFTIENGIVRVCRPEEVRLTPVEVTYAPTPELFYLDSGIIFVKDRGITLGAAITQPERLPGKQLTRSLHVFPLGAPSVFALPGQEASLDMMDASPVEYFEHKKGDEFLRRDAETKSGMRMSLTLHSPRPDRIGCTFSLDASFVEDREPALGTTLSVGKPRFTVMQRSADLDLPVNSISAVLTQFGDTPGSVLLAFIRVLEVVEPDAATDAITASLQPYTASMQFIQVRGEPDWEWWMRPYERTYRMYEGAGRTIGPVSVAKLGDVTQKSFAWSQLGFRKVKDSKLVSAPHATEVLDHRRLLRDGVSENEIRAAMGKPARDGGGSGIEGGRGPEGDSQAMPHVDEVYLGLSGTPRTFTRDELRGTQVVVDISQSYPVSPDKPEINGILVMAEATSIAGQSIYSLAQTFLMNVPRLPAPEGAAGSSAPLFRAQLRCDQEIENGSTAAYLMPVADDEYLIVLTEFTLAKE